MAKFAVAAAAFALLVVAASANVEVNLSYKTLLRSSTKIGRYTFGQSLTEDMHPIYENDANGAKTKKVLISNEPDFSSLLEVEEGGKKKLFSVVQFESPRPGNQYVMELMQAADGTLTPKSLAPVDFSHVGGLWIPCAGSVTPWQSHLSAEEYEPDARPLAEATDLPSYKALAKGSYFDVEGFMRYFNIYPAQLTFANIKARFNPYHYGHITETVVEFDGTARVEKWYTMGRAAWVLATIMPDHKTVYGTDDGTNVGFFKFIADVAGDLSSGRLYAAKMTQTSSRGGGAFRVNWVYLGKGQNDEIRDMADNTMFTDIFETAPYAAGCPPGFRSINQDDVGAECLKLKPGMATAAAFLESRRYAAYKGATVEFSKWEGITFDPIRRQILTAMSAIRYGMENNAAKGSANTKYDVGGPNHVKLAYNKCGCVYAMKVDKKYNIYSMTSLVCGIPNPDTTDVANECSLDGIASPDNVSFMPEIDTLLIAEDTEYHENDALWAYDMKTHKMKRILTTPYGAEVTSAFYYPNINGNTYIMAVAQHPYESPYDVKAAEPESSGKDATVGYFTWKASAMVGATGANFTSIDWSKTNEEKHQIRGTNKVTFLTKKPSGRKFSL